MYESFFLWLHIQERVLTNVGDGQRFYAPLLFLAANTCPLGESGYFLVKGVVADEPPFKVPAG